MPMDGLEPSFQRVIFSAWEGTLMQPDILQALQAAYPLEPTSEPADALRLSLRKLSADQVLRMNIELARRGVTVDPLTGEVSIGQ